MKKFLAVILTVVLLVSVVPMGLFSITASAAYIDGYYKYTVTDSKVKITYVETEIAGEISIPSTLGGYSVASIGSHAFDGCSRLTGITIPDSVTIIYEGAFVDCTALKSITIGSCVSYIGSGAFEGCENLEAVYISNLRKWCEIDFGLYWNNEYSNPLIFADKLYLNNELISGDVVIPNGTKSISCGAFKNRTEIESISLPVSVTVINYEAFAGCDNLSDVWYGGNETNKENIDVDDVNSNLLEAVWHYNNCNAHEYSDDLNSGYTCINCKFSKTPSAPTLESKINNSVTLVATSGFQYSQDSINWQSSNVFTELSANTTYTFYQRVKASSTALVSEASEGLTVYLKNGQTSPTLSPIISSFTDTTVTLTPITNGEYSIDGTTWQSSNVFDDLSPVTSYTFYQRYAETDTCEASEKSAGVSVTTDKSKQTLIPDTPTVQSYTASSITLNAVDGCEYSKDGSAWQSSNVFSGLLCGTEYTFYQRFKETTTTYAGKNSAVLKAKTDKGTQTAPSAPTLSDKTHNSITLTAISGYEYSRDGINWQESNLFTGLSPETNYIFYQRKAETDKYYVSASSSSLTVKTNEQPTYTSGDLTGDGKINSLDGLMLLRYLNGWNITIASPEAMDVNADGKINSLDGLMLTRYLNGWNITLG